MVYLRFLSYIVFFLTFTLSSVVFADIMKCPMGNGNWNYFQNNNKAEEKKCRGKKIVVTTSTGEKIKQDFIKPKNGTITKVSNKTVATNKVEPVCNSTGGVVKFNGRTFHLDYSDICSRYNGNKASIKYARKPTKLHNVNGDYRKFLAPYIKDIAKKYHLEPEFIHAVISAESAYNPKAKSSAGAEGLMQLMPFTAKRFGVKNSYDPYQNIDAGAKYLSILLKEFGTLELAAAGYNAGEGAVRKYNKKIPPFKETKAYVPKVMAFYYKYKNNNRLIASIN